LSSNYWVDVVFDTVSTPPPPPPSSSSYTIWAPTAVPDSLDSGPDTGVELGVTFRSNTSGYITGLRFYKGPNITDTTHVGNLWTNTGTRLATATFTNETASGWQQVNLSTPVAITANTNYVASYYTTSGHFAASRNYFATAGVTNGPLTAPANGAGALNGPYTYGSSSSFPRSTYLSSNYWVDVVFSASGGTPVLPPPAGDTQAPTAPSGLWQSNSTATSMTLSWTASTDNAGVAGYNVYRNGTKVATTTAASSIVSGTCATSYTLAVEAYDAAGNTSARPSTSAS